MLIERYRHRAPEGRRHERRRHGAHLVVGGLFAGLAFTALAAFPSVAGADNTGRARAGAAPLAAGQAMAAPDRGLVNGLPFGRADAALLVAGSVVLGALAMVSMRLVHAAADSTRPIVPTSVAALASHRLEPC